jgi:hypothetical protein
MTKSFVSFACFVAFVVGISAQETENVEVAPIECWSQVSTGAVRVGEQFTMVLTCAVIETQATSVVPDQTRLDPAVIQLPPFEVVGGQQARDLRTSSRRFFQYEYTLRYFGEDFGQDVALPGLSVVYRVENRVTQGAALESREREYQLPPHSIRILSLVADNAADIREPIPGTFRAIESLRFRADALRIAAVALLSVSAMLAVWALVGLFRQPGQRTTAAVRVASDAAVMRAVRDELAAVDRDRQGTGWTSDLAARALAALRIAAALATGRHVEKIPAERGATPASGQLLARGGLFGNVRSFVSGSTTSTTLARETEGGGAGEGSQERADLHDALARFSNAAYGRDAGAPETLDSALESASRAVAHIAREHSWLATKLRALTHSATRIRQRAWAP